MMFCLFVADAIMAYFVPVFMKDRVGSALLMGIILSTSSVAGMISDFSFAQLFSRKKSFFFQRLFFLIVFLFPLSFFLSVHPFVFIVAMVWWGVSYEAMVFTTYHAIHEAVGHIHHAWAWGVVAVLKNIALTIGPLVASATYAQMHYLPLFFAILLNAMGVVLFLFHQVLEKQKMRAEVAHHQVESKPRTLRETLMIWKTLDKVLWPLLLFFVLFYFFDSAVYSVGPLLSEQLKSVHPLGVFFVSLYGVPGIFVGIWVEKISEHYGKKKLAFFSGIVGGLTAVIIGMSTHVPIILIGMFITSFWLSLLHPAMTAVFEDLISRGEDIANDLISLTALTGSVSYVVGPILNGFLAERIGPQLVFSFWGIVICLFSSWLFLRFPRKVKLPQQKLAEIIKGEEG